MSMTVELHVLGFIQHTADEVTIRSFSAILS